MIWAPLRVLGCMAMTGLLRLTCLSRTTPAKGWAAPRSLADRTLGNGKPEGFPLGAPVMIRADTIRP